MAYEEHRCQCCGELADDVFCDDCTAHMQADVEAAENDEKDIPDNRSNERGRAASAPNSI